jgi:PhnB protein
MNAHEVVVHEVDRDLYVRDVDGAYKRALEAGASSLAPPEDRPYQERAAGLKDSFGNIWYIATYTG